MKVIITERFCFLLTTLTVVCIVVSQQAPEMISGQERLENFIKMHKATVEKDVAFLLDFSLPRYISHFAVLDIGSNIGLFSECLILSLKSNRSCTYDIALFEPIQEYHYTGKKRLAKISNHTTHFNYGISNVRERRDINLNLGPNLGTNSYLNVDPNGPSMYMKKEVTQSITLDELMEPYTLKKLDLIKIDVEGFEGNVLSGAMQTIYRYLPDMYVELGWGTRHPSYTKNLKIYNELFALDYFITDFDHCFDYLPLLNDTVNFLWRHKSKENDKLFTVGNLGSVTYV